jgi:hypothetical protein
METVGETAREENVRKETTREETVATAVRFLENDRVRGSTEELKRRFLQKKGLTEEEITAAFSRVPAAATAVSRPLGPGPQALVPGSQALVPVPAPGSRLRDLLNLLLLIGGASYGLRYLWRTYLGPWLSGRAAAPGPQAQLQDTCRTLLGSVQQLQETVTSLQVGQSTESVNQILVQASLVEQQAAEKRAGPGGLSELRAELQSVKGLLLASRSFPQQPGVTPPPPALPAWQLAPHLARQESPPGKDESPSADASSASEIELLNPDSGQELSGEEGTSSQ